MSTGQIFFAVGIAGMIIAAIAAVIAFRVLRSKEKKLNEQIWKEYKYRFCICGPTERGIGKC